MPIQKSRQELASRYVAGHSNTNVITRSQTFLATAVVLALPCASAVTQTAALPQTPTPVTAPAGVEKPAAGEALPQAPSALFAPADTGALRMSGSGLRYVAPGTASGPGGFAVEKALDRPLSLSLDDAVSLGLERNARLKFEHANQRAVRGYQGQIRNAIIPNLQFKAASTAQQLNLAALGFNPTKVGPLLQGFGLDPSTLKTVVKVNTTTVQLSLSQQLFNMPDFELYRAIKPEFKSVDYAVQDSNDQLVQAVATAYLKVLADKANLQNAIAEEASAHAVLDQATQRDQAGVGIRLDVLRAQVEYQQRQQAHVSADNQLDKDGIQLNRIMGLPAGQVLDLTDPAPYQELGEVDLEQARQTAMSRRSDLLSLQQAIIVASHEVKAVRYQRLPTLAVNGFYGILGETTGSYHGVFTAEGSLKVPIFREAGQRGEQETAEAQLQQLRDQEGNLQGTIEAQLRTSLLDVDTASQLVRVARSNSDLARQELADAQERFTAGVTDNLEVVNAETTVTGAEAQLVSALFQFNVAKVGLARSTGVLQSRYRAFLGM